MSRPTILSPWYVVQRYVGLDQTDADAYIEYYTAQEERDFAFQPNKLYALIFSSLGSAVRVAQAEVAEVRVLTTQEEADEFGRG